MRASRHQGVQFPSESESQIKSGRYARQGEMAQIIPSVLDKIDSDKAVDIIAEVNGTNPELIRDADEVALIRKLKQEIEDRQEELDQAGQVAQTAETITRAEKNLQPAGAK